MHLRSSWNSIVISKENLWKYCKFSWHFNEIPFGNFGFQWNTTRNPLEIQLKSKGNSNGHFNEIQIEIQF